MDKGEITHDLEISGVNIPTYKTKTVFLPLSSGSGFPQSIPVFTLCNYFIILIHNWEKS